MIRTAVPCIAIVMWGIAAVLWAAPLGAQGFPAKAVHLVVPTTPGGVNDIYIRVIAPGLAEGLGQAVIVENRGPNIIGTALVAKAAPDGYTLLSVLENFPLNQYLFRDVPYDAVNDFAPISLTGRGTLVLVANSQLGVKDLQQLLTVMKSKGSTASYATSGAGTASHLSVELFKLRAGIDPLAVHFKGGSPAITELVAGRIDVMIITALLARSVLHHLKSGRLVPIAVTSMKRNPMLPDVPALAESFPGFEAEYWGGVVAPAKTPSAIIERLNVELIRVLRREEVRNKLDVLGYEVVGSSPDAFGKWLVAESEKWRNVIRERRITLE